MRRKERGSLMDKVLLVGVELPSDDNFEMALAELGSLAKACGKEPVGVVTQSLDVINKPFYIYPGKVKEVKEQAEELMAGEIIFDHTLSPLQIRNLQKEIGLPVEDRTALILEIFRERAHSREAMLQVEAASLQYMLPRLAGLHDALGRQGGTTGSMSNRGAEKKDRAGQTEAGTPADRTAQRAKRSRRTAHDPAQKEEPFGNSARSACRIYKCRKINASKCACGIQRSEGREKSRCEGYAVCHA